jgi:putative transposase
VQQLNSAKADTGRRYRAYPTPQQVGRLTAWGHCCRAVWNLALAQRDHLYRQRGYTLRAVEQCAELTRARRELAWLADLPAQSAQQVLHQLDRAYDNWWNPQHPAGPPRFKKRRNQLAVSFPGQAIKVRMLNRKWAQARLPKIGWLRFRLSRPLGGIVRNATVTRDGLGWHVAFGVSTGAKPATPNGLPGCGVDFGVACSAYVSDESSPRLLPPTQTAGERRRLLGLERREARQLRWARRHNRGCYSRRLRRTIAQIAALRARQARRRLDFTHKLTTDLAKRHGWVGIEDLPVKGMTRTARGTVEQPGSNIRQKTGLNRAILDNTPYQRRRQLAYKAPRLGSQLRIVAASGTSQTCSGCGHRDPESRPGCGRLFGCTACGHLAHADHNASMVIEARARRAGGTVTNSTRSHPRVARPARGRMREPSGGWVAEPPPGIPALRGEEEVKAGPAARASWPGTPPR